MERDVGLMTFLKDYNCCMSKFLMGTDGVKRAVALGLASGLFQRLCLLTSLVLRNWLASAVCPGAPTSFSCTDRFAHPTAQIVRMLAIQCCATPAHWKAATLLAVVRRCRCVLEGLYFKACKT